MDAGGCSGQAEIGVSEEEVVAGGRHDIFFGDAEHRSFLFSVPRKRLLEEHIRRNPVPVRTQARAFSHERRLDGAG